MLCGEKRYIYIPCKLSKFKLSISNCSYNYLPSLDQAMILFLNVLFRSTYTDVVSVLD